MNMHTDFSYFAPGTVPELHQLLQQQSKSTELLAGGTDLLVDIRAGRKSPDRIIDIKQIEAFKTVDYSPDKGLIIGASVSCSELIENTTIQKHYPLLVEAAADLASAQLRNRATIVGNLCNASPCGDMSRALLCLDASLEISSADSRRSVPLNDFITGVKTTVLTENELVEQIRVPAAMADLPAGNRKLKRIKGHDLSLASVSMVRSNDKLRIAIGSCSITPVLLPEFPVTVDLEEIYAQTDKLISPIDDVRCTADYRKFMVNNYIKQLYHQLT